MNMSIQTTGMSGIPKMPSQIEVPSRADGERREANRKRGIEGTRWSERDEKEEMKETERGEKRKRGGNL